jgi:hypothetical protein
MKTDVRIGRVVLDGLQLSRREREALGPAIARELRRLADDPEASRDRPGHPRPPGRDLVVDGIAREVAAAVHQARSAPRPGPGRAR